MSSSKHYWEPLGRASLFFFLYSSRLYQHPHPRTLWRDRLLLSARMVVSVPLSFPCVNPRHVCVASPFRSRPDAARSTVRLLRGREYRVRFDLPCCKHAYVHSDLSVEICKHLSLRATYDARFVHQHLPSSALFLGSHTWQLFVACRPTASIWLVSMHVFPHVCGKAFSQSGTRSDRWDPRPSRHRIGKRDPEPTRFLETDVGLGNHPIGEGYGCLGKRGDAQGANVPSFRPL